MTWFDSLTGFAESDGRDVRKKLTVNGLKMCSSANNQSWQCGTLEMPSLAELRERTRRVPLAARKTTAQEVVGNVQDLHCDPLNAGAVFQVASQFNLLEMISPNVTPDDGVGVYENDPTQGPACAIACGAGTIYRNYFVRIGDQVGQTAERQIDCLADVGAAFGNEDHHLWTMRNGYALPTRKGLNRVRMELKSADAAKIDQLRGLLRIGVHRQTQVTLRDCQHVVTQAYCSAVPVSYSGLEPSLWDPFARLILEAAYEATFCAAILNAAETGNHHLYLTLLGGGAFGNDSGWIIDAIERSLQLYRQSGLEVSIVSYGKSKDVVRSLVSRYSKASSSN